MQPATADQAPDGVYRRRVIKSASGGWDVKRPRSNRPIAHVRRKRDAEREARRTVRAHGGGSVNIYDADGVFRQTWTYVAELEHLLRGKRFEDEVDKSCRRRNGGSTRPDQHRAPLGWHPELITTAGEVPKGTQRQKKKARPVVLSVCTAQSS